ncbi:hypothetical protein LWI29_011341 [Acer saccharum]|uniref:Ankyrin repeat domain-containing protein, chloroplastic n=1 Tax=Acer saccharum TaxID=4024 RepID=A0AA39W599_ACESA|nr:hypothetical protein LWI29_011341 [Acer saccharum]
MSLLPTLVNPTTTTNFKVSSLLLLPPTPHSLLTTTYTLKLSSSLKFPAKKLHSLPLALDSSQSHLAQHDLFFDLEDRETGDCVVFDDTAFEDAYLQNSLNAEEKRRSDSTKQISKKKKTKKRNVLEEIEPENLVPEKWRQLQEELNLTKKDKRKIAQEIEFGSRVEKRREGYQPLRNINLQEYLAYKKEKMAQLNPIKLDNPTRFLRDPEKESNDDETDDWNVNASSSSERLAPKNPKWAVYGRGLDDVSNFFNSENYEPPDKKSQGPRKLFTKEEKVLLNKKIPDLATATSKKWLPLHTLAASGEFYIVDALLKHNVDINAVDKNGLTALHKAIIGKKQAVTNYLLRESANPFVRDEDGATLLHYAVQTVSAPAIKILLLYNVDITFETMMDGHRADTALKNKDGLTPLDLCLYSGQDTRNYELIKLLKQFPKPHEYECCNRESRLIGIDVLRHRGFFSDNIHQQNIMEN